MLKVLTLTSLSSVLFACASSGGIQNDQTSACANNPFLQKYNCSIDQVEQAAERGDADAEYALGYMYYYGIDTAQDTQTALIWIKRASAKGQPLAIKAARLMSKHTYPTQGEVSMHTAPVTHHGLVYHHPMHHAHAMSASMSQDLAAIPASHYTLQLMGSHDAGRVKAFAKQHQLGAKARTYQSTFHGAPWTVLIYGNYPDLKAAEAAKHHLPAPLKGLHPWVKSFAAVHKETR